uniref:Cell division protein ZipA n=1 Tax=Candidatus Kentrum sp. LPFa TaxID=2126335 RepID=A0A450WTR9_9GAMM|nr:MAG: cell division protein ZipA [Candidatus Kentron sp. LPFa]
MDNFRLILFISGILVIAAIYAWEIFRERRISARDQWQKESDIPDDASPPQDGDVPSDRPSPQDSAKDAPNADAQFWNRPDETVNETEEKVVLGDLSTLDNLDAERDRPVAVSDAPSTPPVEASVAMEKPAPAPVPTGKSDAADPGATDPDATDDGATMRPEADDGHRSFAERIGIRKPRPEKVAFGRKHAGKTASTRALFIALSIIAKSDQQFEGSDIRKQFEKVGMQLGQMRIFHHFGLADQESEQPVFSAADVLEPGAFPDDIDKHATKGLFLFMQLPGPLDGRVAFELMLNVAQQLATSLDGELCDDTRSTLTTQSANHLRERIEELKRKQLV